MRLCGYAGALKLAPTTLPYLFVNLHYRVHCTIIEYIVKNVNAMFTMRGGVISALLQSHPHHDHRLAGTFFVMSKVASFSTS